MFIRNITLFALLQPFVAGENVRGTRNLAECPGEDSNPTIDDPVTERVSTCVHTRIFNYDRIALSIYALCPCLYSQFRFIFCISTFFSLGPYDRNSQLLCILYY